jgi:diacylglycerol kinase
MNPLKSRDLIASFRHAFQGLGYALRTQRNARIHLIFTLVILPLGVWLGMDRVEWCLILLAIGMVWMAELSNTVLEDVVDLQCPGYNPLAKSAKDVKAAVVVVASLTAALVGVLILGPKLIEKMGGLFSQPLR